MCYNKPWDNFLIIVKSSLVMDSRQTKRVLYLLYTYLVCNVCNDLLCPVFKYQVTSFVTSFWKATLAQVPPFKHLKQRILYSKKANLPLLKVEQMWACRWSSLKSVYFCWLRCMCYPACHFILQVCLFVLLSHSDGEKDLRLKNCRT